MQRAWTAEEKQFLQENIQTLGNKGCAQRLGRSVSSIKRAADRFDLLIRRGSSRSWTIEEDLFLKENYPEPIHPIEWFVEKMGRTESAILTRTSKLGLVRVTRNQFHRKLSDKLEQRISDAYANDNRLSCQEIKDRLRLNHLHLDTIYSALSRCGVTRDTTGSRNRCWTDTEEQQICNDYQTGATLGFLAAKYGGSEGGISNIVVRHGLPLRSARFGPHRSYKFIDRLGREHLLRSKWEAIGAHWLDEQKLDWDYEVEAFSLSTKGKNGKDQSYMPDFWIYDSCGSIQFIVDVKGRLLLSQSKRMETFQLDYPSLRLEIWTEKKLKSLGYTWRDLRDPSRLLGANFSEVSY